MTLVTLWFVSAAEPRTVLATEPHADRGFARKYLAQLNPAWPLTHIGDFDMTRSTSPGAHEFYIGAYSGLSVVQTIIPDLRRLSELPERYRVLVPAADVYATAVADHADTESFVSVVGDSSEDRLDATYGGFAHWSGGELKRSFCATRETVFEDIGLPAPFELSFWEGTTEAQGIQLPFVPREAAATAAQEWLGFPVSDDGPTIPIAAFAVDGRPEAKSSEYDGLTHGNSPQARDGNVSLYSDEQGYDDYAARGPGEEPSGKDVAKNVVSSVVRATGSGVRKGLRGLQGISHKIGDEVRRRARGNN